MDVTVIVIVYNDAGRLPNAVESALRQSHRSVEIVIVDDASTDGSGQVADGLAGDRVRVLHRAENSGGCGVPRNDGLAAAHGRYVMFLDSDDTLDRHACRNLVAAAERTGAELVSGCCFRVLAERGDERPWYRGLYRVSAVYSSVRERPDLLYDTLCTNKLYRRDFLDREGLRFAAGLHYEDLLFSTHAYLTARMIAIVPHRVYNWLVVEHAETRSITQQTDSLRGFADRLEILRRVDALYARHDAADLKLRKDIKFLNHDLLLYARQLRDRDAGFRQAFIDLAAGYLATLDPRAYAEAKPVPVIIARMVAGRDADGVVAAAEFAPPKGVKPRLAADLTERDGRVYWCDEDGRPVHDVTELGLHALPLRRLSLCGRVDEITGTTLSGHVANPLARLGGDLRAELEFRDRRRTRRVFRAPAEVACDGHRISWRASVGPLRPVGLIDQSWSVRLRLTCGDETLVVRLTADPAVYLGATLPVRPRLGRLTGDTFEAYVPDSGELAFRIVARARAGRATIGALRGLARTPVGRRWWTGMLRREKAWREVARRRRTKVAVYNRLFVRLPIRRDLVVFESHLGRQYSDNPKYIYEELLRSRPGHQAVWSYAGSPKGFPDGARLVRRGSWGYYLALARAGYWVDNQGFPTELTKRRQTTYIQTWHGSAYKRMGFDEPSLKSGSRARRRRFQRTIDRYDAFLVRSEHDVRTLAAGLGVRAELVRSGYPRNDPLINGRDVAALRERFADGRRLVLYAPTFRPGVKRLDPPFGLQRFAEELGDTHLLLVRPHYLNTVVIPPSLRGAVRDVGTVHDVTELLLITDVLVTDYSSVMFDFALLDRPIVFYVPDLPEYASRRGAYFDLAAEAPGPLVTDPDALFAAVRDAPPRARDFAQRFGEYDRGTAAKQVVERFFHA